MRTRKNEELHLARVCARTCDWRSRSAPPVYTLYRALLPFSHEFRRSYMYTPDFFCRTSY